MDVLVGLLRLLTLLMKGLFWLLGRLFAAIFQRRPNRKQAHGSARWANIWEQWWGGTLSGSGIILGRGAVGRLIRYTRDGMVMVFANTGAGKGVGVVVPTLLTYPGSMLVTDPKGENYAITSRHRATLGKVRMLNPLELGKSDCFNPMDVIRRGSYLEVDDAASLAKLMVKPDARESHWDDKAVTVVKCLILHALHQPPENRTLAYVRRLSAGDGGGFADTLQDIADASPSLAARDIASTIMRSAFKPDGSMSDEYASILSNVDKATESWSDTAPSGMMALMSTFKLEELLEETTTLYICVPEEFLDHYSRWMRVMVGCVLNTLTRQKDRQPLHKVMLLLDEVRVLGRLDQLEHQAGLLRAYCIPVLIWQNLPQIRAVYRDGADAFMATATCRAFFGTEDDITGTHVASMLGNTTTFSTSMGVSQSSDAWLQQQHQQGQAESGYWLLDPAEVQRIRPNRIIIKARGVPYPIFAKRIDYRRIWRWKGRWDSWRTQSGKRPPVLPAHPYMAPVPAAQGSPPHRPSATTP
jgi:type IV secretion system protein VirD4